LEDNLADMTIIPLQNHWHRPRNAKGKRMLVQSPLIPRIVCAGFSGAVSWLEVEKHQHITGVLGVNGTPLPMRAGGAERLREISEALRGERQIKAGAMARILLRGSMYDQSVEISRIDTKHGKWAWFIYSLFGAEREFKIEMKHLQAA
jgi:transcription antitermination factor NusG